MTDEEATQEHLARRIAAAILDAPQFRQMLREEILLWWAENQRIRREGVPREFLACCTLSGIKITLRHGQPYSSKPLPKELETIARLYRTEIIDFMTACEESEEPPSNGVPVAAQNQRK